MGAVIGTSSGAWERRKGRNCPARQRLQNCAQLCRGWGKGERGDFSAKTAENWLLVCQKWFLKTN